jgi:hypothetical protein
VIDLANFTQLAEAAALIFYAGRLDQRVSEQGARLGKLETNSEKMAGMLLPLSGEHKVNHSKGECS